MTIAVEDGIIDSHMKTFAFIDASNLFYGGGKNLGWKKDYKKLLDYFAREYSVSQFYYFGGIEIHDFPFDRLVNGTVPIEELEQHLSRLIKERGNKMSDIELKLVARHRDRARFFLKLKNFGYTLILKPVKTYRGADGSSLRKANCDADMTLMMATQKDMFDRVIALSGDGDFLPILKYLRNNGKEILVLARGPRTAKEIKRFVGDKFLDFEYLRTRLEFKNNGL